MDKDLQLFSFVIDEETLDDVNLYAFKLPDELRDVFEGMNTDKTLSNTTVYKVATAIFDEVIYCNNRLRDINDDEGRWVYSLKDFDTELLQEKVREWLEKEGVEVDFKEEWQYEIISLKEIFKKNRSNIFSIIPQYYLYKLSSESFYYESLNRDIKFYRVTNESGQAEMFTLPDELDVNKIVSEKKQYNDMFSYVVNAKLKAPIDMDKYVLNIRLSIRVWNMYPIINKKGDDFRSSLSKEATSVYVYKKNEYYNSDVVSFNKLGLYRDNDNLFKFKLLSDKLFTDILEIDMKEILSNQLNYRNADNDQEVIALFIKKNKGSKGVEYGPGIPERNETIKLINERLKDLKLREPVKFLCGCGTKKVKDFSTTDAKLFNCEKYFPKKLNKKGELTDCNKKLPKKPHVLKTHENMKLYICTRNLELVEMMTAAFRILLRLEFKEEENIYYNSNGLKVEFVTQDSGFADVIGLEESIDERIDKIKETFMDSTSKELRAAIVDIPRYDEIEAEKDRDSKYIVRNGLKECNIISQFLCFVHEEEENDKKATNIDTVISTALDLISACGFVEGDLYEITGVKEDEVLLGIGKISTGNNENRIAISKIDSGVIYYKIYPEKKWREGKEAIFKINSSLLQSTKIERMTPAVRNEIGDWILDSIDEVLKEKKKTYCFLDSKMRNIWKMAKNNDFLRFEDLAVTNRDYLRMIRFNTEDEVPDYFVYDEKKKDINKYTGIFKGEKSTYYLIGEKSDGDQERNGATKVENKKKPLKRQILCEVNIQGCKSEEEKDEVAKISQRLRNMNISYRKDSSKPFPIYCINRLGEYMTAVIKEGESRRFLMKRK